MKRQYILLVMILVSCTLSASHAPPERIRPDTGQRFRIWRSFSRTGGDYTECIISVLQCTADTDTDNIFNEIRSFHDNMNGQHDTLMIHLFRSDGCTVNSINNPVLMGEAGYPTRVGINDKLMTYVEKAISKVSEPGTADNERYLKVFRENYPGSVIETMVDNGIKYQNKPYDRRLTSYIHMQMANNVRTKVELNVMSAVHN